MIHPCTSAGPRWTTIALVLTAGACGSDEPSSQESDASVGTDGGPSLDGSTDARADGGRDASDPDADGGTDASDVDAGHAQRLAVPMYLYPAPSDPLWQEVIAGAPAVGLVVANPSSGPGSAVDPAYADVIAKSRAAGQTVLGYVHTSYGARAVADVQAEVASWYSFYPAIDGIFFDEGSSDASTVAPYYKKLYDGVKQYPGAHLVALNPGTIVPEPFMTAADVVLSFEDTYAHYTDGTYQANPAWVANYPASRFWHIVLSTPQASLADAIARTRARNAGWIFVTDQGPATAYQSIVTGAYWQSELTAASAP